MAVIAFTNQKGGCSKSTTSVHFARWLQLLKKSVFFVDADAQESSSPWIEALGDIPCEIIRDPDGILDRIPEVEADYDYVVVDSPGAISEAIRAILLVSDLALVPSKPSDLDLRATAETMKLIQRAQRVSKKELKARAFVSIAKPNTKLKQEAVELLEAAKVGLLNSVIHDRTVIADAPGQGKTVWDIPSKRVTPRKLKIGKKENPPPAVIAAVEYNNLFTEALKVLS